MENLSHEQAAPGFQMLAELALPGPPGPVTTRYFPPTVGTGQLTVTTPQPGLTVALLHLRLREALVLRRLPDPAQADTLLLSFQAGVAGVVPHLTAIELISADVGLTTQLPAGTDLFIVNLAVDKSCLAAWLTPGTPWLTALLASPQPTVYTALLTPEIQMVLVQLAEARPAHRWDAFFYQLKAQELVYFLFRELADRTEAPRRCLNTVEVAALFGVRDRLLAALDTAPHLPRLALEAGMNEPKLRQLFRQVFGASIYQYYQAARMEAAKQRLAHHSVSEVGHQLGFSNLSHFTRLFAKHHGRNPKQYQAGLGAVG